MKIYISVLKIIGLFLLIPVGLGVVVFLGFIGLGIDFGNAWGAKTSGGGANSMYIFLLPSGFILLTGTVVYILSRRKSLLRMDAQEQAVRHQVYQEQELGVNTHEVVVNMIRKKGPMTVAELSLTLHVEQEELFKVIRKLLQEGLISQDVNQTPSRFYVLP